MNTLLHVLFDNHLIFTYRIDESEDYIIFQSLVPIPINFIVQLKNRLFFRYKYIIKVAEEKIEEDLGIGSHKWRVIEITKQIREATSESIT